MRVTNRMIASTLINNINTSSRKIQGYQDRMSSATRITRPSDDPVGTARLLSTKAAIKEQEQYGVNIKNAVSWLDNADGTLASATLLLQRCRELAVSGSTVTADAGSMQALAVEADGLIAQLVQLGNTEYAGRYVFGGGKCGQPPFAISGQAGGRIEAVQFISPDFDAALLDTVYEYRVEIAEGVTVDIAAGCRAFHTGADGSVSLNGIFSELINLRRNLDAGDQAAVRGGLSRLDKLNDNLLAERAALGAKTNRLETALDRSAAYQLELAKLESSQEDTDYAAAAIGLSTQLAVFESTLAASAKIMRFKLMDFLK